MVLSLGFLWWFPVSQVWGQTYVSGRVITSDKKIVSSGVVALEKGELHNNAFMAGGEIGPDGSFKIPLPSGGPWGLHVYSEKYLYFPLQIQITQGKDNEIPVILPFDGNSSDDPRISNIRFIKLSGRDIQISMRVEDPNKNLGPQMLAIDTKRYKSYRMVPQAGDLKDKKANFPEGVYISPKIPLALEEEDLKAWRFVVADHQCSNGVIYNGLGHSVFKPPKPNLENLLCDVSGIWKSNFDKTYRFTLLSPGIYKGDQFEDNLLINKMTQQKDTVMIEFTYEGKKGQAALRLLCQNNTVILKGPFNLPDRSGEWIFAKLKNAENQDIGKFIFNDNCSPCHYDDRKDKKVGPGLSGLFKNPKLPASGRPTSERTVLEQIIKGGRAMPSFSYLNEEERKAIIEYLKSL